MDTQDFNKELLDYLYGEMSAEEKKEFEKKMAENSDLQREYSELSAVREELDQLKDKEVMEPFTISGRSASGNWLQSPKRKSIVFRPVTAIAATLLMLMLLGYMTKFSISVNDNGVFIGYGVNPPAESENYLAEEDVKKLVDQAVTTNNELLLTKLSESQNVYDAKFTALQSSVEQSIKSNYSDVVTNEDLEKFFSSAENKNTALMKEYLKLSSTQQQEYFKSMLTHFNEFLQQQRNEDLKLIRNSLIELKQNQDIQNLETNQAIASLFTSVSKRDN